MGITSLMQKKKRFEHSSYIKGLQIIYVPWLALELLMLKLHAGCFKVCFHLTFLSIFRYLLCFQGTRWAWIWVAAFSM